MQILTAEEAAAFLRVPKSTIYAAGKKKELAAMKLGRHFRVELVELMRWAKRDPNLTPTDGTSVNGTEQTKRTTRRKR